MFPKIISGYFQIPKIVGVLLLLQLHSDCGATSEMLDALKHNTDRWIEIKARLSEEQITWQSEKEILLSSLITLRDTKKKLQERIDLNNLKTQSTGDSIDAAQTEVEHVERTMNQLEQKVVEYESRILKMASRFPDPLLEELQTHLSKIPKEQSETDASLAHRLLNVVSIMTAVDEFNNELHEVHTIKEIENGEVLDLQILYWGLSGAYACNGDGTKAWRLTPGSDKWDWTPIHKDAQKIKNLFLVYEKSTDPELIAVPFNFQKGELSQ